MAHLRPLRLDEIQDEEIKERFTHYKNTRGFTPHSIMTMARRPNIVKAFMALNQAVLYEGTVSEELKMLISLMTSQATGCQYCQAHMANLSSIYKASDEKIRAIWEFQTSELFSDAERAALTLAYKSALVPNHANKEDFDEVKKYFDEDQIVEIVAAIALFGYLNRWNDTVATELEEHAANVATRAISPAGWAVGKHSQHR